MVSFRVPNLEMNNQVVQDFFDFLYLRIIDNKTQLENLYTELSENNQTHSDFLIKQKSFFEKLLENGYYLFYEYGRFEIFAVKINFGDYPTIKMKYLNPQFVDCVDNGWNYTPLRSGFKLIRIFGTKIQEQYLDTTEDEFLQESFGKYCNKYVYNVKDSIKNCNHQEVEIIGDSSCLTHCNYPIVKTYVFDSSLAVELKLIESWFPYDLFIHEFSHDKIHIFDVEEFVRNSVKEYPKMRDNMNDFYTYRDCFLLDDVEENFSKEFCELPTHCDSTPIDIQLNNFSRYLSKSKYFKGITQNDTAKISVLKKLLYLTTLRTTESGMKNQVVQDFFDLLYLRIINDTTELNNLYFDLYKAKQFKYNIFEHWFLLEKDFFIRNKPFLSQLLKERYYLFYEYGRFEIFAVKINFGDYPTVKMKYLNPQFINFAAMGCKFYPLRSGFKLTKLRGTEIQEQYLDTANDEFLQGSYDKYWYKYIRGKIEN